MNLPRQLVILGASVRAAAQSAAACGIVTWGGDLFADRDAAALGTVRKADAYPGGLLALAEQAPEAPWMYTGALENHPRIVEIVSRRRLLAGNDPSVLALVRNLDAWQPIAAHCGLAVPATLAQPPAELEGYLRKTKRSTAGMGVERAGDRPVARRSNRHYWQRLIEGRAGSTLFVSNGDDAVRLGSLPQLPRRDAHVPEFQYCGSSGAARLPAEVLTPLDSFASEITAAARLRGIWGLDHVWDGRELFALEINPRWTAGAEILERCLGRPLVKDHLEACLFGGLPPSANPSDGILFGKRVVYARRACRVSDALESLFQELLERQPMEVADIPQAVQQLAPGQPVCTVFAQDLNEQHLLAELARREGQVLARAGR